MPQPHQKLLDRCVLPLELKSLESKGAFSGYASVFHVTDFCRDQILPGAFQFSLKTWKTKGKWPFLLWQHRMENPIGFWTHIQEDDRGLFVNGQLLLEIQQAQEAYALMKANVLEGLSIGFKPIVAKKDDHQRVRKLFQVDLVEISLVTFPANPEARLHDVRNA
ncbi:MAG: HK97 family phage prohead protease [Alphaproteobacteria bacterium]